MILETLLEKVWKDYISFNPQAKSIHDLLAGQGETILNDHIAYRTFNHPSLGIKSIASIFEKYGYKACGEYVFKEKKLFARHYEHPDATQPKIFISELELEKISPALRAKCEEAIALIPPSFFQGEKFAYAGRPWPVSHKTYLEAYPESEYAAWLLAFGFRPNHFTVNVNALKNFKDLNSLNVFLEKNGFKLNSSGGVIKGSPEVYLEQSSTMAGEVMVDFLDGKKMIPACYYEFAKRYSMKDGNLYQGFVEKSADKIFESTNKSS